MSVDYAVLTAEHKQQLLAQHLAEHEGNHYQALLNVEKWKLQAEAEAAKIKLLRDRLADASA